MKNKLRTAIVFLTGVLVTTCFFQFVYPPPKDAMAEDPYACIRNDLDAQLHDRNVGDQEFTIIYAVPSCISGSGYNIKKTFIYDGRYVAVTYNNPNFTKSSFGGSSGGGFSPIN